MIKNEMIGKPFEGRSETVRPCWLFCSMVWADNDLDLPMDPSELTENKWEPAVLDIALFQLDEEWHAGVVWPDGLHFIHAQPMGVRKKTELYVVCKDRLTAWPWKVLLRGCYR